MWTWVWELNKSPTFRPNEIFCIHDTVVIGRILLDKLNNVLNYIEKLKIKIKLDR